MSEHTDIRDRSHLRHSDIIGLNFIRSDLPFVFRRHYREGLRSHIFEVHDRASIDLEKQGILQDGIPVFPRSVPRYMLRLFRHRFSSLEEALAEINRFQVLLEFVSPSYIAVSNEFLTDYRQSGPSEILLCGLQEFVRGEIFDPWSYERHPDSLPDLIEHMIKVYALDLGFDEFRETLNGHVRSFVQATKELIVQAGFIPDLSGVGNLILTPGACLKLVDINNISPVVYKDDIFLDDKGYPVCDRSVEVLAILEKKLLGAEVPPHDELYEVFLHPDRLTRVRQLERAFRRGLKERDSPAD